MMPNTVQNHTAVTYIGVPSCCSRVKLVGCCGVTRDKMPKAVAEAVAMDAAVTPYAYITGLGGLPHTFPSSQIA
jgi:hypothetical protein